MVAQLPHAAVSMDRPGRHVEARDRPGRTGRRDLLARLSRGFLAAGILTAAAPLRAFGEVFEPFWVQAHRFTELWSATGADARSFGPLPRWSYLKVVASGAGSRLHVWVPYTKNYAYVDASAVGPVGAPSAAALAQPPSSWVASRLPTVLWSRHDSRAVPLGQIGHGNAFELLAVAGPRLRVRDPRTDGELYLDAATVDRIDPPSGSPHAPDTWWGAIGSEEANIRSAPDPGGELRGEVEHRTPVTVRRWVAGQEVLPDQPTWAELDDDAYVYSPLLRPAPIIQPPAPPKGTPVAGRWIDANLTHQVAVAYEGVAPMFLARFSSGRPGWETSTGVFPIARRVANETMDSSSLLGIDAGRASYRLQDIKWTQYFTSDGQAIHHNYWRDPALIGVPSSHGCLGMLESDARWLWEWASIGTLLVIHY